MEITKERFMEVSKEVTSEILMEELNSKDSDPLMSMMLLAVSARVIAKMTQKLFDENKEEN